MTNYNTIEELFNADSASLNVLVNNVQYDDNSFTIPSTDLPYWLRFNNRTVTSVAVSGNSFISLNGGTTETIKFNRRDAAMYYLYSETGILFDRYRFYRLRWRGYSNYSSVSSSYLQEWDCIFFSTGDVCIHAINIPTSNYAGTFNIVAGTTQTYTAPTAALPYVTFHSQGYYATEYTISQEIINYEKPVIKNYETVEDIFNVTEADLNHPYSSQTDRYYENTLYPTWLKMWQLKDTFTHFSTNTDSNIAITDTYFAFLLYFSYGSAWLTDVFDEVGTLYGYYNFYRIRWKGYSTGYAEEKYLYHYEMAWDLVFFDNGFVCIHAVTIPEWDFTQETERNLDTGEIISVISDKEFYYRGGITYETGESATVDLTFNPPTEELPFVSFYPTSGIEYNIINSIINIPNRSFRKYLIREGEKLYTVANNQLQEVITDPGTADVSNYNIEFSLWASTSATPPVVTRDTGNATAYIQPIMPGQTYTVTTNDIADRWRLMTLNQTPIGLTPGERMTGIRGLANGADVPAGTSVTFTAGTDENYLLCHVSAVRALPNVVVFQAVSALVVALDQYGISSPPSGELVKTLVDPEILYWDATGGDIARIQVNMTATPNPQTLYSQEYSMAHASIVDINHVTATAEGNIVIAVTFDSGTTWLYMDGTEWATTTDLNRGMTAEGVNSITSSQWNGVATTKKIMFRITLLDVSAKFTNLVVYYNN